jgi:hypothetical protein
LLPPHIDLEHVSQYNEHGRALVTLIQDRDIFERHHPLILGLFAVYSLLISLGHFTSANISWPPHSDFRRQDWLDIGFAPEAVDILELLPYLKDDINYGESVHIAYDASTLSYLGKGNPEYRGIDQVIPEFLDPKDFFVTGESRCMYVGNFYYLYKSEDGMFHDRSWHPLDADILLQQQ